MSILISFIRCKNTAITLITRKGEIRYGKWPMGRETTTSRLRFPVFLGIYLFIRIKGTDPLVLVERLKSEKTSEERRGIENPPPSKP